MQNWSALKIINFGEVSCLFTFSCLFTLAPNSAMLRDRAHLIQCKVGQHEKILTSVRSADCLLSAVCLFLARLGLVQGMRDDVR